MYEQKVYRQWVKSSDLVNFEVKDGESDLFIAAENLLKKEANISLKKYRKQIQSYIKLRPEFKTSLRPLPIDENASEIVRRMQEAAKAAGVGPMAAVAGAIAEFVGRELLNSSREIIVENGGDIFLKCKGRRRVALFAGVGSVYTKSLALEIDVADSFLGICASSKTVGPSLSLGNTDATIAISDSAVTADAWATALGNRVGDDKDIDRVLKFARTQPKIKGVVIVVKDKIGMWGEFNLVKL